MAEVTLKIGWLILALVHALPAAVFFIPELTDQLYGVPPTGEIGLLLIHRGALFLGVFVLCLLAIWHHPSRKAASVLVGISVLSFLFLFAKAGFPGGSLTKIAMVDIVAIIPLVWVSFNAWRMSR